MLTRSFGPKWHSPYYYNSTLKISNWLVCTRGELSQQSYLSNLERRIKLKIILHNNRDWIKRRNIQNTDTPCRWASPWHHCLLTCFNNCLVVSHFVVSASISSVIKAVWKGPKRFESPVERFLPILDSWNELFKLPTLTFSWRDDLVRLSFVTAIGNGLLAVGQLPIQSTSVPHIFALIGLATPKHSNVWSRCASRTPDRYNDRAPKTHSKFIYLKGGGMSRFLQTPKQASLPNPPSSFYGCNISLMDPIWIPPFQNGRHQLKSRRHHHYWILRNVSSYS